MPTNHTYTSCSDANAWVRKASDSFYFQCTTRTVQESKLFPVNPYIAMSYLNALVPLAGAAAQDRRRDARRGARATAPATTAATSPRSRSA